MDALRRLCIFLLILLFLLKYSLSYGLLNIEELNTVKYALEIVRTPVLYGQSISGPVIHLSSIYGQEYQCTLPEIESILGDDKNNLNTEDGKVVNSDIIDLLKPIQSGPCLVKTKDWWTYELCAGKNIQQYHLEADGKIVGNTIILGRYESDYDWKKFDESDDSEVRSGQQRYHTQFYTNGTKCDLNGQPRKTEVRYMCEEGASDHILHVDEPESCHYVMTVHTARLCQHPLLKAPPVSKPHAISCSPMLTESDYQEYLKMEEEKQRKAEERRKEWLAKQDEKLEEAKRQENLKKQQEAEENAAASSEELPIQPGSLPVATQKEPVLGESKIREAMALKEDMSLIEEEAPAAEKISRTDKLISGEDDEAILNELEKEVDDLEKEGKDLAKLRHHLKRTVQAQFDDILNEAEDELQQHMNSHEKDMAYNKLAETLNKLLEKLDKTEKDIDVARGELDKAAEGVKEEDDKEETDEKSGNVAAPEKKTSDNADSPGKVSVRVSRLSPWKVKNLKEDDKKAYTKHRQLERAIQDKLKRSGLDTGGGRVEVRVLAASNYDDQDKEFHVLSDEETEQVQTLIMSFLTGNQEAAKHMQQQHKLEENYKFVWGKDDNEPVVQGKEED